MSGDVWDGDLSKHQGVAGMRIPPGNYRVEIEDAELTETSGKTPMVNIWLTVLNEGEFQGATITDRLVLTPELTPRTVEFLNCIGLTHSGATDPASLREFVGKVLEAHVVVGEPYNGRVRAEVRGSPDAIGNSD